MNPTSPYIIHNPVAGTSDPERVKEILCRVLKERGLDYKVYQTKAEDSISEIARAAVAEGYQAIWAVGGDGTASAAANGLIGGQANLGIIPTGSGNSLARELGIPLDVEQACLALVNEPRIRRIDAIQVEDSHYLLWVSVGIGSETMARTRRSEKRALGRLAYLITGLRLMISRAIWPFEVIVDGKTIRVRSTEVIAANAGIIGYRTLRWGQQVKVDDGQLNLCYVKVTTVKDLLLALWGAAAQRQDQVPELGCLSAQEEILISCATPLPVEGDGEVIGTTPVRLKLVPEAISILTSAD